LPAKPQVTLRFLKMLAAAHAHPWNASQMGQSLGLSYHTVNSYLDFLVGAFLIRRLPPYHANIGKRLVKSPKIYWRDTGLLHAVLNVLDEDDLLGKPWVGFSWEGFVIEQVLGALQQVGRHCDTFFLRTSDQHEIDLVLDFGKRLWAVEVKLTTAPDPEDFARLKKTANLIKADRRILITQTTENIASADQVSCNLPWLLAHVQQL
jgi:predicted AAA+ superfamily ATPase